MSQELDRLLAAARQVSYWDINGRCPEWAIRLNDDLAVLRVRLKDYDAQKAGGSDEPSTEHPRKG